VIGYIVDFGVLGLDLAGQCRTYLCRDRYKTILLVVHRFDQKSFNSHCNDFIYEGSEMHRETFYIR